MARPRRDATSKPAFDRIEDAFWQLLSEKPFDKITIAALSKTANVNHNLIYYYFDNLDDVARQLFERNMRSDLPSRLIRLILDHSEDHRRLLADPDNMQRVQRLRLFMRSDNPLLNAMVRERLEQEWLSAVGVEYTALTAEQRVDLQFIFSGIVATVGSDLFDIQPEAIITLYQRPLGHAIADTLQTFAHRTPSEQHL